MRYGVKVKPEVGENTQTVWLIDYLEYIVVHELVHLLERRHNDHFTAVMDTHLPNWRHSRDELNSAMLGHDERRY